MSGARSVMPFGGLLSGAGGVPESLCPCVAREWSRQRRRSTRLAVSDKGGYTGALRRGRYARQARLKAVEAGLGQDADRGGAALRPGLQFLDPVLGQGDAAG